MIQGCTMKHLYIIRHSKAEDRTGTDYNRELVEKGREKAEFAAEKFKMNINPQIDLFISSPAPRALQTAEIFAEVLEYPSDSIRTEEILYEAKESAEVLPYIQAIESNIDTVALFGHNPLLEEMIEYLSNSYVDKLPKCGIVLINFNTDKWDNIKTKAGEYQLFKHYKK